MAKQNRDKDIRASEVVISNPLMREEVKRSADQAQRADFSRNISQYLFWGATSMLGAAALSLTGIAGGAATGAAAGAAAGTAATAGAGLLFGFPLVPILLVASAITFIGSVVFSQNASKIEQYNEVLRSDIDSQNQAHRMVQAFAKAQTQGQVQADNSAVMTSTGPSWAERSGGARPQTGTWQERVTQQAEREQSATISALRS